MLLIDGCTSKMIEVLIDGCTSNDSNGYLNSKTDLPILDHQRSHSPIDRPEQCQEPRLSQHRIGTSWGYLMGDVSCFFFFGSWYLEFIPALYIGDCHNPWTGKSPKANKKIRNFHDSCMVELSTEQCFNWYLDKIGWLQGYSNYLLM
jgi:hypothetical protein